MAVFYLVGVLVIGFALYISLNLNSIKRYKLNLKIN